MTATNPDSRSLSQQRFGAFARRYVASSTHARGEELNRLVEIAQPQSHWLALDVATGGGHTALKFAPFVAQAIATDITPEMLKAAQAFIAGSGATNVSFGLADAEDLPFEDGAFDLVTCRIAPHHFPDCLRFVREGSRVLKAGGLLLVQDHVLPQDEQARRYMDAFERLRDPSHNRAHAEGEWADMFRTSGLRIDQIDRILKGHDFIPWAERQGCTPEVIERLVGIVRQAPEAVVEWMRPRDFGTPGAVFLNHHIIIAGRKC